MWECRYALARLWTTTRSPAQHQLPRLPRAGLEQQQHQRQQVNGISSRQLSWQELLSAQVLAEDWTQRHRRRSRTSPPSGTVLQNPTAGARQHNREGGFAPEQEGRIASTIRHRCCPAMCCSNKTRSIRLVYRWCCRPVA